MKTTNSEISEEDAIDELLWGAGEIGPDEHLPADRVAEVLVRYPQHAEAIQEFVSIWDALADDHPEEGPLTEAEARQVEYENAATHERIEKDLLPALASDNIEEAIRKAKEAGRARRRFQKVSN